MKKNILNIDSYELESFITHIKSLLERKSINEIIIIIEECYEKSNTELYKLLDIAIDQDDIKEINFILDTIQMNVHGRTILDALHVEDIIELVQYVRSEIR